MIWHSAIKNLKFKIQDSKCQIVYVSTPDYEGGLETGYAKAVEAVIESIVAKNDRDTSSFRLRNLSKEGLPTSGND